MKRTARHHFVRSLLVAGFLIIGSGSPAAAPNVDRNVFITASDGTRLATDIYMPSVRADVPLPLVMIRTPYGKHYYYRAYDEQDSIVRFFNDHGYAVAVQDKRGRFNSEGVYLVAGSDAEDGYDTIDWLSAQSWSNGRVGSIGCSYEGNVQIYMAQTKHPALKAMIPQASGGGVGSLGGYYRDFSTRVGGVVEWVGSVGWFGLHGEKHMPRLPADLPKEAYNKYSELTEIHRVPSPFDFRKAWYHLPMKKALSAQGMPPTDFEDHVSRSPTDPYWRDLPHMTDSYTSDVPSLFINSWYDFGTDMTLVEFNHFRENSVSEVARNNQFAIISPHTHCEFERSAAERTIVGEREMGDTRFDYRTTYLTWFSAWLKEDAEARAEIRQWPQLRYFAMGTNEWRSASAWPVPDTRDVSFLLESDGRANSLAGDGRLVSERVRHTGAEVDYFEYDPANPVPSLGGPLCCTGTPEPVAGSMDQRSVESRNDVLVYTSTELDQPLDVTGDVRVILHVSSDAIDTDFTAKLIDVYPDGRAFNILESILRARYRQGQDREVWMEPGEVYELRIPLGPTSNVFLAGHRVRLEITSSNFPRFERNLNRGGVNVEQVTWAVARNGVHHTVAYPSRLILPVLEH